MNGRFVPQYGSNGRAKRGGVDLEVFADFVGRAHDPVGGNANPPSGQERIDLGLKEKRPAREVALGAAQALANWAAIAIVSAVVLVVALGATTASPVMCTTCHATTSHGEAKKAQVADPHGRVACVRCHEPSGWLGSLTIEVPGRLLHMATGWQEGARPAAYGVVTASACKGCHRAAIVKTTLDDARGVRMSHKEPIKAGAQCRDCHTLDTGVISSVTVGMAPCLACHDGKRQSVECKLCHVKDVSVATRSHVNPAKLEGRSLIATPDCGGCHNQVKECDPCHGGVRMPHTGVFKWWGHARAGAKDMWFNNGQACAKCHTAQRRPCTKCHMFFPTPAHGTSWSWEHQQSTSAAACDSCHGNKAYVKGRNFCELCHGKLQVTQ